MPSAFQGVGEKLDTLLQNIELQPHETDLAPGVKVAD
jgi:hypothetical protein